MPEPPGGDPLVPSLLDRLTDDEPTTRQEAARARSQTLRELRQSIRRDLEDLLNTRIRPTVIPAGLEELEASLTTYGIPDIIAANLGDTIDRAQFFRRLQAVIALHEPRFKSVVVKPIETADSLDRTLRFRVDALLRTDPAPEPIVFDTAMEPSTGQFVVKGSGG